jgi:hypothetical protein
VLNGGLGVVSTPQVKQPFTFNQIYSMMSFIKLSEYLWGNTTGENVVGSERRMRERGQENRGLPEREKDRWSEI